MLNQITEEKIDRLAELLNALADPTRVRIILGLTKPSSISSLGRHLQIGQSALMFHINQMQDNGLLSSENWNGEAYYSLSDVAVGKAVKLLVA
ncbi:helix-turn-helix transcriptional regulator [Spirosoma sp. KNUC1025]|uniref:ArsR/SmtB family transcription factor n=1 Tax=Spirosoma sp. KNUC1025 TaxID=2894082 RepID=UPI003867B38D|nr:helix-turn-helix domain-containing protein [Spirosoma sp. KNUC1025]